MIKLACSSFPSFVRNSVNGKIWTEIQLVCNGL